EIPPLHYEVVARLKREFPGLRIIVNGGIRERALALELAWQFDGIMIGREAYQNPYFLVELDAALLAGADNARGQREGGWRAPDRTEVIERMSAYAGRQLHAGQRLHAITRHLSGLFAGQPGARQWRRLLSEHGGNDRGGLEALRRAGEALGRQLA